eukprot:NODE_6278_length_904_cov_33.058899_g5686_i0.p1 GENE.NODE_6278_length_904_cov_33.058899_g5686_i0~~NODE_6278_length_904_cov_33.058899_g5686_i0.p1  ORF type:complete len:232 (+),score=51.55 NODE_6278_length_904_cov_33.058899_g5686_i0:78-773(+)
MPKSKKEKKVLFTKVKEKGMAGKERLVENVRHAVDDYKFCYVFDYKHLRLPHMKEVRTLFADSRFFVGNNKVMQLALGRADDDTYQPNLYKLSAFLKGHCGLFFTNRTKNEIKQFFKNYSAPEFARAGDLATTDFTIPQGPLESNKFPVTMDPYLRKLGLSTKIDRGVVLVLEDLRVCEEGQPLTSEASRLLELWGQKTIQFKLSLVAVWAADTQSARKIKSGESAEDGDE